MNTNELKLSKKDIETILPQREPFLFVDEIIDVVRGESVTGKKTLTGRKIFSRHIFQRCQFFLVLLWWSFCAGICIHGTYVSKYGSLFGFLARVDKFRLLEEGSSWTDSHCKIKAYSS